MPAHQNSSENISIQWISYTKQPCTSTAYTKLQMECWSRNYASFAPCPPSILSPSRPLFLTPASLFYFAVCSSLMFDSEKMQLAYGARIAQKWSTARTYTQAQAHTRTHTPNGWPSESLFRFRKDWMPLYALAECARLRCDSFTIYGLHTQMAECDQVNGSCKRIEKYNHFLCRSQSGLHRCCCLCFLRAPAKRALERGTMGRKNAK